MTTYTQLAHFNDYWPPNFGWSARDPKNDSSLLVPFKHSGANFGLMHKDVVPLFTALLDDLVPLIPGGIAGGVADDGCYNPASVSSGGSRSFHTYAIAVDINWRDNPMNAPRPTGPRALPPATSQIARKYGCEWGGDWTSPKDWMHIECHLNPDVARRVSRSNPTGRYLHKPWPVWMPAGHYFGLRSGPVESHGGFYENEQPAIMAIQARLRKLGYSRLPMRPGIYDLRTKASVTRWQRDRYAEVTTDYGNVYADDWRRLFTYAS